jgi:hypothetical protein
MSLHPPTKRLSWGDPQAIAILVAGVIGGIAVIVAALIGGDVINVSVAGPSTSSSDPAAPTSSTGPAPPPTETSPPSEPTGVIVRRITGDKVLTLTAGYGADLDSMKSSWDVKTAENKHKDVAVYHGELTSDNGDMAIVSGSAKYETCRDATAYQMIIEKFDSGLKVCVRTSAHRYAFVTVKKFNKISDEIQLDVVVWDPPFE